MKMPQSDVAGVALDTAARPSEVHHEPEPQPGSEATETSVNAKTSLALPKAGLKGKRIGMVTYSPYPADPRPRRAIDVFVKQGATVDLICLRDGGDKKRESLDGITVTRLPITHRRGGKLLYVYNYLAFIALSTFLFAARCIRNRYDVVYVHNMPDVLVLSAMAPKMFGAKVVLDMHDPMPELMTTIYGLGEQSLSVRVLKWLERWSMARVNAVITVNIACKRIFCSRSCPAEKVSVVMNSPDGEIFPSKAPRPRMSKADGSERRFVIMYHGSLVERNGLDLAVQALADVREAIPGAELRIYGRRTPFLDQVMAQVRGSGLQDCVRFLGPRRLDELVGEIDACDVGIIPNRSNQFTAINTPTRVFEYLALGKPVIAPQTRGIEDYFGPDALLFFEPGNVQALAQRILEAYAQPTEALETAKRGREVYVSHAWSRESQVLVNVVGRLVNAARSA